MSRACRSRTFFCSRAKKDSMAALSPAAPTWPIDPWSLCLRSVLRNWLDRNCDPRSLLTRTRVNSDYAEVFVKPRKFQKHLSEQVLEQNFRLIVGLRTLLTLALRSFEMSSIHRGNKLGYLGPSSSPKGTKRARTRLRARASFRELTTSHLARSRYQKPWNDSDNVYCLGSAGYMRWVPER